MEAIVVEENLLHSGQNTRYELTDMRKAFGVSNVTKTITNLVAGQSISIPGVAGFFHFHSTQNLEVTLSKGGQTLTLYTQMLTIASSFDQVILNNREQNDRKAFIVYA